MTAHSPQVHRYPSILNHVSKDYAAPPRKEGGSDEMQSETGANDGPVIGSLTSTQSRCAMLPVYASRGVGEFIGVVSVPTYS